MVGFGRFLREVTQQHGVEDTVLWYDKLKELLEYALMSEQEGGLSDSDSPSGLEGSADQIRNTFEKNLENELCRVNDAVKRKLRSLQRVRKAINHSRSLRASACRPQEQGVALMQLSNVYDDVILVLWFMYLNSIAVSKIVKKYNKSVPQERRILVDPSRWLFLRAGLVHAQRAKVSIEAEFAAHAEKAQDRQFAGRSEKVTAMADGMKALIKEHRHHLYIKGDSTEWAVAPVTPSRVLSHEKPKIGLSNLAFNGDAKDVLRKYEVGLAVGCGAYGVVHRARHRTSNNTVAIKTIYDAWSHPVLGQRTYREILIMQELRHPNIVPLNDIIVNGNKRDVHLVMPFISHTLEDLLAQRQLLLQHKKWFMLQLTSALSYMHARGVVHRDLKLSNILIDDTPKLFLSDFGLARTLSAGASTTVSDNPDYVQTQWYRAPEVLLCSRQATPASDMWSVGCILAELLTGVPLFPGQDDQHQLELILGTCPVPDNSLLIAEVNSEHASSTATTPASSPLSSGRSFSRNPIDRAGESGVLEEMGELSPKRSLADVLDACWKSGVQEDFEREGVLGLLSDMMQFEPRSRPHAHDVLRHPWLQDTSFPTTELRNAKIQATPCCGEGQVALSLSCTALHSISDYRVAIAAAPTSSVVQRRHERRVNEHENAALIQRAFLWKYRNGERPPLRRNKNASPQRSLGGSSTARSLHSHDSRASRSSSRRQTSNAARSRRVRGGGGGGGGAAPVAVSDAGWGSSCDDGTGCNPEAACASVCSVM